MIAGILSSGALPIGVEIASDGVRLLQLRRSKGSLSMVGAGHVHMPDLCSQEPVDKRRAIAKAVRTILAAGSFQGRTCVANLPTKQLMIHSIRMPAMPDDELVKALRYEVEERYDVDPRSSEIGFVRLGEIRQGDDVRHEVIVTIAEHRVAVEYLDALLDAGLRPKSLETSFGACARAFNRTYRRKSDESKVRIVLNVGHDVTDVLVLQGCQIGFYRAVDLGGRDLDEAVADHLGLQLTEASDLRRRRLRHPEEGDSSIDRALRDAIRPLVVDLAHEAALCQRYYSVTFRGDVPAQVLIAGPNAREPNLLRIIGEEMKVETTVGRPLEHVEVANGLLQGDRRGEMAEWATAVGLSLKGQREASQPSEKKAVNFAALLGREAA